MESGQINKTTQRRLHQNNQECRNMMKSGHQKDVLECSMQALPDPIKGAKKEDEKTDEEVARKTKKTDEEVAAKHIDESV
jgi:hypothetical protein